jgi:hypothetical protein
MDATLTCPDFMKLADSLTGEQRRKFLDAIKEELLWCMTFAQKARRPHIHFGDFRETPRQLILEFQVFDLDKPTANEYNWHGHNTSQWAYAGAIVYDRESGRISTHH